MKEGTTCPTCGKMIKYMYCDDTCGDFHSDINDPRVCDCSENFNPDPEDFHPDPMSLTP